LLLFTGTPGAAVAPNTGHPRGAAHIKVNTQYACFNFLEIRVWATAPV